MVKKFISSQLESLDTPIPDSKGFLEKIFKKKKIQILIINEDLSYITYFRKKPKSYLFEIGKRRYILISKCIIYGKFPTILYYYNNPLPLELNYTISDLTALDLRNQDQLNNISEEEKVSLTHIKIDSETLNLAFNTRVMRGLYSEGSITTKTIVIILITVTVIILIFLQVFGVVDVWGLITGASTGTGK